MPLHKPLHSAQAHQRLYPSASFTINLLENPTLQFLEPPFLLCLLHFRRLLLFPTVVTFLVQPLHLLLPYLVGALTALAALVPGVVFLGGDHGAVSPVFLVAVGAGVGGGCEGAHGVLERGVGTIQ